MMKKLLFFILILAAKSIFAQVPTTADLTHTWKIKKGWFGEENIVFVRVDTAKEAGPLQIYNFTAQNTITTQFYSKKQLGFCGNGMLYFDAASWKLDVKDVEFEIKGGRFAESKFHYKMTYSISLLTKGMLVLKLEKTELKEEKKF